MYFDLGSLGIYYLTCLFCSSVIISDTSLRLIDIIYFKRLYKNYVFNFFFSGIGQFFCYSPPGQVSNLNVPLVVTFDFTDGLKRDISFSFTYLSNPNISAVYPRELLYT